MCVVVKTMAHCRIFWKITKDRHRHHWFYNQKFKTNVYVVFVSVFSRRKRLLLLFIRYHYLNLKSFKHCLQMMSFSEAVFPYFFFSVLLSLSLVYWPISFALVVLCCHTYVEGSDLVGGI